MKLIRRNSEEYICGITLPWGDGISRIKRRWGRGYMIEYAPTPLLASKMFSKATGRKLMRGKTSVANTVMIKSNFKDQNLS